METQKQTFVEEFKVIEEYTDYIISNTGKVISTKGKNPKELKLQCDLQGYLSIQLCIKGQKPKRFKIHKLVSKYFLNASQKKCINHIDGNKLNNNVWNLEYCTHKENIDAAIRLGIKKSKNAYTARAVIIYDLIDDIEYTIPSMYLAAKVLNVTSGSIYNCCNNKQKTVKGFKVRYAN